jgi:phosphoglycerate dehydrogenase-like enzyme
VARGPVVDYFSMLNALNSGAVSFYASDVGCGTVDNIMKSEPFPAQDPLALHKRSLFTPHVGGVADVSYQVCIEEIR